MPDKKHYKALEDEISKIKTENERLDGLLLNVTAAHMALRDCVQAITNLLSEEDEEFVDDFLAECKRVRKENLEELREKARLN